MENPTKMDEIHGKSYSNGWDSWKILLKWMRFRENPTKMYEIQGKSY